MESRKTDFGHAADELTATPWLAHLAGAAAAAAGVLVWSLAVFVAPEYLAAYRDEAVALPISSQLALTISHALAGVVGWVALLAGALVVYFAWGLARARGGAATAILFALAAILAAGGVVIVLACGEAGHAAQDWSEAPR